METKPKEMKQIHFPYEANKKRVVKEVRYNLWKGVLLAIFTGFAISVILIFALVPGAAEAFDDIQVGMSTLYALLFVGFALTFGILIIRSAKRSQ